VAARRKAQLKIVDEGRGWPAPRQGASAVAIDAQGNGGSKAALQAAAQAAIEAGKNLRGLEVAQRGAESAHDKRAAIAGGAGPAAHVAEDDER